jgi:hypothetical protein
MHSVASVTLAGGAAYHHVSQPTRVGALACPACGETEALAFHSWWHRTVEHVGVDQPTYLVLTVGKYRCGRPACPRKYFTPPVAEAAPHAHTSARLRDTAKRLYRRGKASLREVETALREDWRAGTGKSSVLRWHVGQDFPRPAPGTLRLSSVLCIDEVYDRVGGKRVPIFTCVDPLADITIRVVVERADAAQLAAAMQQVKALGASPRVIGSDLWAAYGEALARVWPLADRQLCWFHVMQWTTKQLNRLLVQFADTLPEADRKLLRRLRFRLLAAPETLERQRRAGRIGAREQAALDRAWTVLEGTAVAQGLQLRNEVRALPNASTSRQDARERFDALRRSWPEAFHPPAQRDRLAGWRPGQPLPPKDAPAAETPERGTPAGAEEASPFVAVLDEIRRFFVQHFAWIVTYLDHPGAPRTNNHAERANRCYRSRSRPRYGWKTRRGHRALLVSLQGLDTT